MEASATQRAGKCADTHASIPAIITRARAYAKFRKHASYVTHCNAAQTQSEIGHWYQSGVVATPIVVRRQISTWHPGRFGPAPTFILRILTSRQHMMSTDPTTNIGASIHGLFSQPWNFCLTAFSFPVQMRSCLPSRQGPLGNIKS